MSWATTTKNSKLRGLSPRANYTDRATAIVGEVSVEFADRGCRVVSATDPHGRILGFLKRSRYYFFQVAPQLYSRGWVDPVPDPLDHRGGHESNYDIFNCTHHMSNSLQNLDVYSYLENLFVIRILRLSVMFWVYGINIMLKYGNRIEHIGVSNNLYSLQLNLHCISHCKNNMLFTVVFVQCSQMNVRSNGTLRLSKVCLLYMQSVSRIFS
jgi:hypothetical protein